MLISSLGAHIAAFVCHASLGDGNGYSTIQLKTTMIYARVEQLARCKVSRLNSFAGADSQLSVLPDERMTSFGPIGTKLR